MNYIYCRFHSLLSKITFYEMILIWFEKSWLSRFIKLQSTSQCNWWFYCSHLYFCWIIKHYYSEIGYDIQNLSWSDLRGWSCQREKRNFYLHGLVFSEALVLCSLCHLNNLRRKLYIGKYFFWLWRTLCKEQFLLYIIEWIPKMKLFLTNQNRGWEDEKG